MQDLSFYIKRKTNSVAKKVKRKKHEEVETRDVKALAAAAVGKMELLLQKLKTEVAAAGA